MDYWRAFLENRRGVGANDHEVEADVECILIFNIVLYYINSF